MVAIDSTTFLSTLYVSTTFFILVLAQGTEGAHDPSPPHIPHLIQNPFFSSVPEGNYQDFYETPSQFDSVWKRTPSAGFYGMRGKKVPSNNFYGMRGKKGPIGFLGMRGKKFDGGQGQPFPVTSEHGWGSKESPVGLLSDEERVRGEEERKGVDGDGAWEKRAPSQGFMGLRGKRSLEGGSLH